LKDAGFEDVYYTNPGPPVLGPPRQIFIGVVDPVYKDRFSACPNLNYCDEKYWQKVLQKTKFKVDND
jgi:hypothetical protein